MAVSRLVDEPLDLPASVAASLASHGVIPLSLVSGLTNGRIFKLRRPPDPSRESDAYSSCVSTEGPMRSPALA